MTTSSVDVESILVLDIGSVHTRSLLFDTVDGQYRFIAAGMAPSTLSAPYFDIGEGIHQSLLKLQAITARSFLDHDMQLILPSAMDGSGVDRLMVIFSAGPELQFVTMGLLEDVSLASATHLAQTMFGRVVEEIGLNDRRHPEAQIDAILKADPDLIIFAGGSDKGATRSIAKLVELLLFYLRCVPEEKRPEVLYAGNSSLANRIKEILGRLAHLHTAPNVRPTIDQEDLNPATDILAQVIGTIRGNQIGGFDSLGKIASTPPIPTCHGMGRMIAFLSKIYDSHKGVLKGRFIGGAAVPEVLRGAVLAGLAPGDRDNLLRLPVKGQVAKAVVHRAGGIGEGAVRFQVDHRAGDQFIGRHPALQPVQHQVAGVIPKQREGQHGLRGAVQVHIRQRDAVKGHGLAGVPVSYPHLTLPTTYSV